MGLKPCCIPLRQGVTIIAGVEMIGSVFVIFFGIVVLVGGLEVLKHLGVDFSAVIEAGMNSGAGSSRNDGPLYIYSGSGDSTLMQNNNHQNILETNPNLLANVIGVTLIIVGILCFLFHFLLYRGAKLRNERDCKIWLIIYTLIWILGLIQLLRGIHLGDPFAEGVGLILNLYFIWVVYEFRKEILAGGENCGEMRPGFHSCA